MMKRVIGWFGVVALILSLVTRCDAQKGALPMPRDIRAAYEKGTRSYDGNPGKAYWQNETDYAIDARFDPRSRLVTGSETVRYRNNGPDTLRTIVIQLPLDMYKAGMSRLAQLAPETLTDGMIIRSLAIDGVEYSVADTSRSIIRGGAILRVRLQRRIPPRDSATIRMSWETRIPAGTNIRMGMYDSTTFFVGYWYPKIAVCDDINGWDLSSYDGENEFYHEYGTMDVSLTLPHGFLVWSTGELQNAREVFDTRIARRLEEAQRGDSVVHVVAVPDLDGAKIFRARSGDVTWKYRCGRVPDFAFGTSDHYVWDAASARMKDGRRVALHAAYNPASASFKTVAEETRQTVLFLSDEMPGFPFPYPQMTVFHGDEGMEYPMIVNDGDFRDRTTQVYVHTHEISHTYFPFFVGIDQRKYAWMEESWAYFLPVNLQERLSGMNHFVRAARTYERFSGKEFDYPLMVPTSASTGSPRQILVYFKGALAYRILEDYLGRDAFLHAMGEYIRAWAGKHPLPYDFFYTFDRATGKDLSWLWKSWFFESGYPDIGIADAKIANGVVRLRIRKFGSMPVPIRLTITPENGKPSVVMRSVGMWADGAEEVLVEEKVDGPVRSIELGGDFIPDGDASNNSWKF